MRSIDESLNDLRIATVGKVTEKNNQISELEKQIPDEITLLLGEVRANNLAMSHYLSYTFAGCVNLTTVPLFDTSNAVATPSMFQNCSNLIEVPLFDMNKVTNMASMFYACSSLSIVPPFNTSNATNMNNMFNGCRSLTLVPQLDMSKVKDAGTMFAGCTNLTECWICNVKTNLTVGSGSNYGHLLTLESLIHLISELVNVDANRTLTIGSVNLEKIADVYVKLIDVTDEMRAEDNLIDSKLPFVQCESTDEGAILITNYVLLKKWSIV